MNNISVIIPTYNRPDTLEMVLPSYYIQKNIKEVIIIDDGSDLDYQKVIEHYKNLYPQIQTKYYRNSRNSGAAASRNRGIELATGEYILWGEDDAFLRDDYTEVLLKKIADKEILFGSIYYGIRPDTSDLEKTAIIKQQNESSRPIFDYQKFEGYYRLKTKADINVPFAHALFLTPKKAYRGIKYFENYKVNGYREESDAQVQMTKNGYRVIYTSDTECYHFPSVNKKGGQHSSNRLLFEIYKIKNNCIFYNRNFDYFKETYKLKHNKAYYKCDFIINELKLLFLGICRKLGFKSDKNR